MAWPTGHFHLDPEAPEPYGICDSCNAMYNLKELRHQYEWRGRNLVQANNLMKCGRCIDKPNEQNRTIMLPIDPAPIKDPRPIRAYAPVPAENFDEGDTWDDDVSEWQT